MAHSQDIALATTLKACVLSCCPRYGSSKLFAGYLKIAPRSGVCEFDFGFADSSDGPAVFIILIAGFLMVAAALIVSVAYRPPYWVHAMLWLPLTEVLCLGLLRPFIATLIALQYRHRAEEGKVAER